MIGVEGQYLLSFNLEGKKDFIEQADLTIFKLVEEVGNVLPTFELIFESEDEDILPLLNEGNDLEIQFGKDRDSIKDVSLVILNHKSTKIGFNSRLYQVRGMISALSYINDSNLFISEKKSGVAVLKSIVSKHFKTDFNISVSSDSQKWIQYNISDKRFVNDLWLHSHLNNSFLATGITIDKKFLLRDMKLMLNRTGINNYDWKFTQEPKASNDIAFESDNELVSQSGFINNWIGNGREKLVYNLENDTDDFVLETAEPLIALTRNLGKRDELTKRFASVGMQNENTHENYWKAYYNNLTNLASLSQITMTLSFKEDYKPIKIFDVGMLKDYASNDNKFSSEYYSGLYITTNVTRIVNQKSFITVCKLNRESLNQTKTNK